uniref:Nucleocapsid n=1 Tax=Leptomonas pyrrhocoris leishbunyavirus 1 TaxID=3070839 RepID=A0AA50KJJ1_9VIRU|nr:nucleocapsid [Leptomonas pyrrhocoris leishbunyavirus 1]
MWPKALPTNNSTPTNHLHHFTALRLSTSCRRQHRGLSFRHPPHRNNRSSHLCPLVRVVEDTRNPQEPFRRNVALLQELNIPTLKLSVRDTKMASKQSPSSLTPIHLANNIRESRSNLPQSHIRKQPNHSTKQLHSCLTCCFRHRLFRQLLKVGATHVDDGGSLCAELHSLRTSAKDPFPHLEACEGIVGEVFQTES